MSRLVSALTKVGGNTGLSRILGFIRDLVFARLFGADAHTDAFFVAFKIPNLFRRLFAEGAFAAAFVPVLSEYKETRSFDDLKSFIDHVAGTLGLFLLLISLLGVLGAPLLIAVVAPGWYFGETGEAQLAGDMLRLTFPYLLFISLTAFAGGILNTHGQFGIPAFTPVLLNLCLIAAAYFLTPFFDPPIMGLAWGVLIAGIAQFAFQLPFLH
ncbi:lipid II flippase MurJ, partial [Solemya velum gill symbiont]